MYRTNATLRIGKRYLRPAAWLAAALAWAIPDPVIAHPHAWIEARTNILFDDEGRIAALNVAWEFDEMTSLFLIEGLETDDDGNVSQEALRPLTEEQMEALRDYDFFTFFDIEGASVPYAEVTEYTQYYSNGYLTLAFRLPLAEPLDPRARPVVFSMYDPTFFIAIELASEKAVTPVGSMPGNCEIGIGKSVAEADEFAFSEEFWTNQAPDDIGAIFAQPVKITCLSKAAQK